jgi:2-iminobutanoate/2-iminopropanoate deaminase
MNADPLTPQGRYAETYGEVHPFANQVVRLRMTSARTVVSTPKAPAAIGPYSQAIVVDGWIFASGQICLDPASNQLEGGDVATQTRRVLANLAAVLEAAGGGLHSVVKTTVFLTDLGDFTAMNEVYAEAFGENRPARSTVEVSRLPRGVAVEIEAVGRVEATTGT